MARKRASLQRMHSQLHLKAKPSPSSHHPQAQKSKQTLLNSASCIDTVAGDPHWSDPPTAALDRRALELVHGTVATILGARLQDLAPNGELDRTSSELGRIFPEHAVCRSMYWATGPLGGSAWLRLSWVSRVGLKMGKAEDCYLLRLSDFWEPPNF